MHSDELAQLLSLGLTVFQLDTERSSASSISHLDRLESPPMVVECVLEKGAHDWTSLIHIAQASGPHKRLLIELVNRGYHLFRAHERGSLFVHRHHIDRVWDKIESGEYIYTEDHLVYQLSFPEQRRPGRLLVVFSPVASNRFTQFLDRHFSISFKSIGRYLHDDTLILRIADLGGVVGSFYLPTTYDPQNNEKVQRLIRSIASKYRIPEKRIVLYGASKGGTGALYTALQTGFRCVAIDPIVSRRSPKKDPYYAYTAIFPEDREKLFLRLAAEKASAGWGESHITVVTSPGSAEHLPIHRLAAKSPLARCTQLLIVHHPGIERHADVGPRTVPTTVATLNNALVGLNHSPGVYHLR